MLEKIDPAILFPKPWSRISSIQSFVSMTSSSVSSGSLPIRLRIINFCLISLCYVSLTACTPRVAVEAPKEPITINLNVKIDHEVRVKVEKDLDEVISEDSDLF